MAERPGGHVRTEPATSRGKRKKILGLLHPWG